MQSRFMNLKDELQNDFPQSEPKLTLFPSGAAMLDIRISAETYVLAYYSNVGVGVNRMSTATFGWEGYDYSFEDFEDARAFLLSLLHKGS